MRLELIFLPNEFGNPNKVTKQTKSAYYVANIFQGAIMKDKKLTVTLHIGGTQVETLTAEQCESLSKRLSETMSCYYTANPTEYAKLKN